MTSYDGPERRRGERRAGWRRPWNLVGPYVLLCLVVVAWIYVQGQNTSRVEREGKARSVAICEFGNARSLGIRGFIADITPPDRRPTGEQLEAFEKLLDKRFPIKNCDKLVDRK